MISQRDKSVEQYYSYAMKISNKYQNIVHDPHDRISFAGEALVYAIDNFDARKGMEITSYISNCIRSRMLKEKRTQKTKMRGSMRAVSMDAPIKGIDDCEDLTMHDVLPSNEKDAMHKLIEKEFAEEIRCVVNSLPKIQSEILSLRYLSEEPMSKADLVRLYDRPRGWVNRKEKNALSTCRKKIVNYLV